jgi:hypothetical protein
MRGRSALVVLGALLKSLAQSCLAGAVRVHTPGRDAWREVPALRGRAAAGAQALAAPAAPSGL